MKKILQINSVANWGSTGKIVEDIGLQAMNCHWESRIAYGVKSLGSASELYQIDTYRDIYWHAFQTRLFDNHGLCSKRATKKLIAYIKNYNPDIIHLHNIHNYYLNYPLLFNYLSKLEIPIVWTIHDCWAMTGHCAHYTEANCYKWKTKCYNCPLIKTYPQSLIDKSERNYELKKMYFNSLKNLTLIPVSNWLAEVCKQSFLSNNSIHRIYSGIDTDVFSFAKNELRSKYNIENNDFVILGVSNYWDERKGLQDFMKLAKFVPKHYKIILIGLTRKQIRDLPEIILGINRTNDQRELAMFYSMADVYFNSSNQETFGLTTIEAMSCGTPVIVYNSTACPEAVSEDTGYIVESHNLTEVQTSMRKIEINKKESYSKACRERVVTCFEKNKQNNLYLNLYDKLTE